MNFKTETPQQWLVRNIKYKNAFWADLVSNYTKSSRPSLLQSDRPFKTRQNCAFSERLRNLEIIHPCNDFN